MFMRVVVLLIGLALLLTGCSAPSPQGQKPSPTAGSPTAESLPTPTPTATATGDEPDALVFTIDGVAFDSAGERELYDGEKLLALIEELTGTPRQGVDVEGPYGGYFATRYEWPGISVAVSESSSSVAVTAQEVAGLIMTTPEGIAVGSSRDDVIAAGGYGEYDEDGDGVPDYFALGARDVPDTNSLTRPGEVGREYVLVAMDGEVVRELQNSGNDFSDI